MGRRSALPPTATNQAMSMFGYLAALGAVFYFRQADESVLGSIPITLVVLSCAVLPAVLADLFYFKRWRDAAAGLSASRKVVWAVVARKWLGLATTFVFLGALYVLLPEYEHPLYRPLWSIISDGALLVLLVAPFYFAWCVKHLDPLWDGYDEMGCLALGRFKERDWRKIGRHIRNWLVRGFFLPIMLVFAISTVQKLIYVPVAMDFLSLFLLLQLMLTFADALYSSTGYVVSLRALNSHLRSSDPTIFGWVVTLACYAPFWNELVYMRYLNYEESFTWQSAFEGVTWLIPVWGGLILIMVAIYNWTFICFGIRFSNLTYRGLISSGPYRFCKHPGYVAKNISWWLVSVPFMQGGWQAVTNCLLLFGVNILYYLRAVSEERHLSNYPEYVEYALAMNERSIFRSLTKFLPFLKYKKPKNPPKI